MRRFRTSLPFCLTSALALALMACGPSAVQPAGTKPVALKRPSSDPSTATAAGHSFGRVLDLAGNPAAGVTVRGYIISDNGSSVISARGSSLIGQVKTGIISNNGGTWHLLDTLPSPDVLETRTGDDGRFDLSVPAGKTLNVEAVQSDELKAIKLNLPASTSGLELQLAYTGSISGKVTTPSAPQVTNLGGVDVYVPGTSYVAKTDDDGSYTIDHVPVGTFRLEAAKTGLGQASASGVVVQSKAATQAPTLALSVTPPMVGAIAPTMGGPGTEISLTGSNFGASTGAPVTRPVCGATAPPPRGGGPAPTMGGPGTEISLTGSNFGASTGAPFTVQFGGSTATNPSRIDDNTIKVKVPSGAASGDVVVTVQDIPSEAKPFTVLGTLSLPGTVRDLRVGATEPYVAVVTDDKGKTVDSAEVQWKVDGAAASVDAHGVVTAVAAGVATLSASCGSLADSIALHIAAGPVVTTLAGNLPQGSPVMKDGVGGAASFQRPSGIAMAADGRLLIGDATALRVIGPGGMVTTLAGSSQGGNAVGKGKDAQFGIIYGTATAPDGTIYVSDSQDLIRKVTPDGTSSAFVGTLFQPVPGGPLLGPVKDGPADTASFGQAAAMAVGSDGTLYVADFNLIRAVTPAGVVSTLAGGLPFPAPSPGITTPMMGQDGAGTNSSFNQITSLAVSGTHLYVADIQHIRDIDLADPTHPVHTLPATIPAKGGFGLAASAQGRLYVALPVENQILTLMPTDPVAVPLVAGGNGFADGLYDQAKVLAPLNCVLDGKGHLFTVSQADFRVRRIDLAP